MVQRFQGPYSQPKTARSRVPNAGSGRLGPPRNVYGEVLGGPHQDQPQRGPRPPFRGRMSPRPSLAAYSWGRAMGAMSRAMGPWGGAAAFAFSVGMHRYANWAYQGAGAPGYNFGPGWTLLCSSDPNNFPLEQNFKMGINPGALVGVPNSAGSTCGASAVGTGRSPFGTTVPAGATLVQLVQSAVPFPNVNGRPYQRYSFPGGSPAPVPYTVGKVVLPMPDGLELVEAVAQPGSGSGSSKGRYTLPYQSEAVTIVISRPRDDGSERENTRPRPRPGQGTRPVPGSGGGIVVTDEPHNNVPPGPTEREVKPKTGLGKSLAALRHQYGKVTEVQDVVKCLEKSLPRGHPCRRKGRGLDERAACLISHADDIDLAAAATCIAADQVTDAVIGKLSRGASRNLQRSPYTPKRPYPLGPLTGGFGARMR